MGAYKYRNQPDKNMQQRRHLASGCFVIDQSDLTMASNGTIKWAQVIGEDDQACMLSLYYVEAASGSSPTISVGANEAVLFLQQGQCSIWIGDRRFDVTEGTGVHVRQNERFSFLNQAEETSKWIISICPRTTGLDFSNTDSGKFDSDYPERTVSASGQEQHASGDRYYKLLVGPQVGSESITQFIGRIPLSKAPEHFHLYEEAICILSGHGCMWTGDQSAEVQPGSMIFLPRKQVHSLECRDEDGMELIGVFYPAGSPAINYET
jgi:mannose-6-phosphate isomerase-like protein (cupin superfamily)